jgi:vancomycin resistance protein YoaR
LAQTNNFGIEELIGVGTSNFTHSAPERVYNVTLATSKFNGVLIPKGAVISFNDLVGDISSLTGYKQAYVIKNGRTVLGDGGGVCQVSTTLF